MYLTDFSAWRKDKIIYGGSVEKLSLQSGGSKWLVKLSQAKDAGVFSEYIASKVFDLMGIEVQEVCLGLYEGRPAAACRNFLGQGEEFVPFYELDTARCGEKKGDTAYCFDNILRILDRQFDARSASVKEFFWDMYVTDALLANRDRHAGNWGFIRSGALLRLAPVFDNEYCLFPERVFSCAPEAAEELSRLSCPLSRIYRDGAESCYADVPRSGEYEGCTRALGRLYRQIRPADIEEILYDMPLITQQQRELYYRVLTGRLLRLRDIYARLRSERRKEDENAERD